jgi:hypothetical protein
MAARKTPSRGGKPDKLMRDAIALELHQEMTLPVDPAKPNGRKMRIKKLRLVARGLVNAAIKGDVPAAKEINDRMDGKVVQKIAGTGKDGAIPIDIRSLTNEQLEQLKERLRAGLPSGARPRAS